MSISFDVASMMIYTHSMKIGIVVIITRIEKKNVQIGSAIYHSGLHLIIIEATITPMLCTISPKR